MDTPRDPRNPAGDPLLDPRLARFAERSASHRSATRAHGTLPPPPPPARRPAPTARTATPRRHHAARGSRALAIGLSIGSTLGLTGWMFAAQAAEQSSTTAATSTGAATAATTAETTSDASSADTVAAETAAETTAEQDTTTDDATSDTGETAAGSSTDEATTTSASGLADGTYTGDTFSNRWGDVQVQITVEGGVITDVAALQVPTGDHESDQINAQAVPYLESEALAAQSADIDTVSGATYTSEGYRQSLQTAIDDARAAATAS